MKLNTWMYLNNPHNGRQYPTFKKYIYKKSLKHFSSYITNIWYNIHLKRYSTVYKFVYPDTNWDPVKTETPVPQKMFG